MDPIRRLIYTGYQEPDIEAELGLKYLQSIYSTVHEHKFSFLSITVGRHRAGKSMWEIVRAMLLDKTFDRYFKKRVVYSPQSFMEALDNLMRNEIYGGAIVWDEAGYGLPARDWYDMSNKAINYALQVFGYLRPIILFVTQDSSYIDSGARRLLQAFYDVQRPSKDYAIIKPYHISYDRRYGKVYFPHPRIIYKKRHYVLKTIKVPKPPKKLIDRYIAHAEPWKKQVIQQQKERTNKLEIEVTNYGLDTITSLRQTLEKNWENFTTSRSKPDYPQLDTDLISFEFKVPTKVAKKLKRDVEITLREAVLKSTGVETGGE